MKIAAQALGSAPKWKKKAAELLAATFG